MIQIRTSHRLADLEEALAAALPPPGRLFDGPWLVLPSRPIELHLDLALARRRGISGNLDTLSLRAAFARLCAAAAPEVVLVDRALLLGELLGALAERPRAGDEALRPVDDYLRAAGTDAASIDRRRVELARAFASLLDDWEQTRPERLSAWRRAARDKAPPAGGSGTPSSSFSSPEAVDDPRLLTAEWRLWMLLHGPDGRFPRRGRAEGRRYLTLGDFLDQDLDRAWAPPPALHLFGFSEIPRGWLPALQELAGRTALSIYAYNPCREFWEDLDTRRAPPKAAPRPRGKATTAASRVSDRQLALGLFDDVPALASAPADLEGSDNPCLARWGQLGREAARTWGQLGDGDTRHGAADEVPPATLLATIQRDVVDREPSRTGARQLDLPPDGSLTLLRAPDARREIETVAAEIWRLIRDDPTWRFCDVAVLVAGPDEPYLSLIPSVFHEASRLPHTVVDGALGSASRLGEAILGLLSLPLGAFTRREVLELITHPNLRARFPEADPGVWLALCEGLGIARGADRAALGETYLDRDAFSWDQGLRRLALGRFATGSRSGAALPLALPDPAGASAPGAYLPAELADDFRADADALGLVVRSLLGDAAFARGASWPVSEWVRFVHALCDAYVVPTSADDEAARLHIFAALDRLATSSAPAVPVSLAIAHELVRDAIGDLRGTRGQVFGNGVVVGSIGSLRALPFRAVFVVGLGPDRFPAAARTRPLDPGGLREPGDATPTERDRYAFLQALLAAGQSLTLSAVDRDPATGDARDPSSVVLELTEIVTTGYARSPAWVRRVPGNRDEDPLVRAAFPAARAEAEARALGASLAAEVPDAPLLDEAALRDGLSPAARNALAPLLGLSATFARNPAATRARAGRPRILRLADLRRFLECPLQGGARITLGLRHLGDDTDARDTTDEPFDVPRSLERVFLSEVFAAVWDGAGPPSPSALAAAYERVSNQQRIARVLPAGLFGRASRERHLGVLESWRVAAASATELGGPAVDVWVGRPDQSLAASASLDQRPALRFRVTGPDHETELEVELRGHPAPTLSVEGASASVLLSISPYARSELEPLQLFLDHVLLAATAAPDQLPHRRRALILRPPEPGKTTPGVARVDFDPLSREQAHAYLATLVADIFGRTHDYLFPCEAVFLQAKDEGRPLVDCIVQVRDDPYYSRTSPTAHGPVAEPFLYPIPPPALALAMAERRFALFFELRRKVRAGQREDA